MPKLINVSKKWGNRSIFDNLSLEFDKDKTTAIIGKSGIGKTTLFKMIARLTDFEGEISGFGRIHSRWSRHGSSYDGEKETRRNGKAKRKVY